MVVVLEFYNGRYVLFQDDFYMRTISILGVHIDAHPHTWFTSYFIRFIYLYILVWTVWLRASTYIRTLESVTSVRLTEVSMSYILSYLYSHHGSYYFLQVATLY